MHAGKRRQQRVVGIEIAVAERVEEARSDELEEPGGDDEVGLVLGDVRGQRRIPVVAGLVRLQLIHEHRHTRRGGPVEPADAVPVGADRDDPGAVLRIRGRVEQGLQVAAGPGDEDDQAGGRGVGHPSTLPLPSVIAASGPRGRPDHGTLPILDEI
jgi:hypothetical protein